MENTCYVYKHTNLENGLVYYGIADDYMSRWNDGFGYQNNTYFWNDIVRYGWKNFKHEIIFKDISREEAKFYEGMLIQETQSYLPENGYNQNIGQMMKYEEVIIDDTENVRINNGRPRSGRGGTPVYYDGKIYLTMKEFCDETGEDAMSVSQMLNPNSSRRLAVHLQAKGLRYATEDEVQGCIIAQSKTK